MSIDGYLSPEIYARDLLHKCNLQVTPTPLEDICKQSGIKVIYSTKPDAPGLFFIDPQNNVPHIIIKDDVPSYSRKAFTLAHEIGHCFIPGHSNKYSCSYADLLNYTPDKLAEKQANEFASELLMPTKLFVPQIKKHNLSLESFSTLSNVFQTSLQATAIKFIKNTPDVGAIIYCQNGKFVWAFKSKSFSWNIRNFLHPWTYAYDFFNSSKDLIGKPEEVNSSGWLLDTTPFDNLIEETISMPYLKATFTLIHPAVFKTDNEDEEYLLG